MLASLLSRTFRAIARRLSSVPTLEWTVEGGVSAAVWTAPEAANTVTGIRFEIRPDGSARQPFVLTVSPDNYVPLSFPAGDLETAHELALRQLAVARHLPAVQPEAPAPAEAVPFEQTPDTASFRPAADTAAEILPGGRNEAA